MDLPSRGEIVEGNLWEYHFTLSANQDVTDPCDFGTAEPSLSQFLLDDHQPQPAFNFPSVHEEFENEHGFVENHQNLQNEQSYLVQNHVDSSQEGGAVINGLAHEPSMVNDHGSFAEPEGDRVIEEIPPNSSMVHDYASSSQEMGSIDFKPTFFEQDVMMDEFAPYSSMVDDLFPLSEEEFLKFMSTPNVVSPNEGHVILEEPTQNSATLHCHGILHDQHDAVERGPVNVPCPRPNLTFRKGKKLSVRWTHALHRCFVSAIKDLGGSESATPERIKSVMNVPGLTRHHVKSHLQKYRDKKLSVVDNIECARRVSVSKVLNLSSNLSSSYVNSVPVPSNSLVITEQGNATNRKSKGKGNEKDHKGKGKGKMKA